MNNSRSKQKFLKNIEHPFIDTLSGMVNSMVFKANKLKYRLN